MTAALTDTELQVLGLARRDFAPLVGMDPQRPEAATAVESARIHFRGDHDAVLKSAQTTLSVTRITAAQLTSIGYSEAAIDRLLAPPSAAAPGPKTPLLRLDWPERFVLYNPHNGVIAAPPDTFIEPPAAPAPPPKPPPRPVRWLFLESAGASVPPPEHWDQVEQLTLGFAPWPEALPDLLAAASKLHTLQLYSAAQLGARALATAPLPALHTLVLKGTQDLDQRQRWRPRLQGLTGVRRLRVESQAHPALLAAIAESAWWPQLTHLDLDCYYLRKAEPGWSALWQPPPPRLRWLRIRYFDAAASEALLLAHRLPALERLALVHGEIDGALLARLGTLDLPRLELLDLRAQNFQPEHLAALVARQPFPALQATAASFTGDERIDYTDWDGTIVGHGYAPMGEAESTRLCLSGSQVRWLQSFPDWD